jgi:hypothetical protein
VLDSTEKLLIPLKKIVFLESDLREVTKEILD